MNADEAIKEWVEKHTDAMYQHAFYKTGDEDLAKDLVQDTFIAAYQKMDSFEGKSKARTWLFSILNYKIIDHYRKQFRNPVNTRLKDENIFFDDEGMWLDDKRPQEWDHDKHLLDDTEFLKVLDECMGKLPLQWSLAIRSKYLSEKDGNEICKELEISATNYWQLICRAKLNLRECLHLNWFK